MLPDVAPPVLKFVPVQEVPLEDQDKVVESPVTIEEGLTLILTVVQAGVLQARVSTGDPTQAVPPPEAGGV